MILEYLPEHERILIKTDNSTELRGIKNWFERYVDGYLFDPRFKNKIWNGKETKYDKDTNTIPMGLWKEALKCCQEFGYPFNFVNKKEFPIGRGIKKEDVEAFYTEFFNEYKFQPRDYQVECAFNILKNRYCNISVATSGGKTLIYSMVIFYLMKKYPGKKFLLVVPSKTLVTQFYDDLLGFNYRNELYVNAQEIFAENEKPRTTFPDEVPNLVIGTFQSLSNSEKYPKKWFQKFFSITTDEGHKSASKSYRKILRNTFKSAEYRWGMSGTFPDDSTHEMAEIMSRTGPIVDTVKAKKLMDAGFISKVKIKGIMLQHNDYEFTDLIETVAARDKKSCYDLECAKIQESEERLKVINQIVSKCQDNTLVLFHNTEYGQKIFDMLVKNNPDKDFYYIDGSVKNTATKKNLENNRSFIKSEMEKTDGRVKILVASFGTLSTGVSIDAITNVIFTQSFKKEQVIIQSIGRALRLHKEKSMAYIFDLIDVFNKDDFSMRIKSKFKNILLNHGKIREKIYKEEEYPYTTMTINLKPVV